ncbi:MAG TPA: hypothetical protein VFY93_08535 [Planctomycetota bacterium]|nr:hypothetical protein [Planctomycetota bacterium]
MTLRGPRIWIAIASAAVVLYMGVGYVARPSPGPLATVHEREKKLVGIGSCSNCHGGWLGTMTDSCVKCHDEIGAQLKERTGLHGVLKPELASQCARCHSDHHGLEFAMVNKLSFAEAGVPDRDKFDHDTIGYEMRGKHLEQTCDKCHKNADAAVIPEGEKRFLGLDQACVKCHEDVHKGTMGQQCASCHGQEAWDRLHSEGHEKHLALVGGHGDVACRTCHAQGDPIHSLEAIGAGRELFARDCAFCHESPHRSAFTDKVALLVAKTPGQGCITCHVAEHLAFKSEDHKRMPPEQHAASGFPLTVPHDGVGCDKCHNVPKGAEDTFPVRYPGRGADDCKACHEDIHKGQFDKGPFAAAGCVGCHDRERWTPHAFDVAKHDRTKFPLTGRHAAIECNECHKVPAEKKPRVFSGTPLPCEACHEDAHQGYFARFAKELGKDPAGSCARCHLTTSFADVPSEGFDHKKWTGFPLGGAHAQSACESCHRRSGTADDKGRTFGWISKRYGKVTGCVTCHMDPHRGEFDREGMPARVDGREGCVRCHVETSFRTFPEGGFDHGKWTGFVLDGKHATTGCSSCHAPLRKEDKFGRTWARAKGSACADCHEDPHAGQFLIDGRIDCRRCHRSADGFKELAFRHNFDSRFALGRAHANVPCDKCHKPERMGNVVVIRYRPVPRECADCHTPDELLRARGRDR